MYSSCHHNISVPNTNAEDISYQQLFACSELRLGFVLREGMCVHGLAARNVGRDGCDMLETTITVCVCAPALLPAD